MSETLSVTLSETSRTEKRFGGNEKTGIIRYEDKDNVGVNIRVLEKVKHNAGMIVLALLGV